MPRVFAFSVGGCDVKQIRVACRLIINRLPAFLGGWVSRLDHGQGPGLMQRSRQRRSKSRDTCTSRSSRKDYFQALDGEKLLAIGAVECSLRFYTGRRLGPERSDLWEWNA